MLDVIFLLFGIFLLLIFIKALLRSKSPLKNAALSMLAGVGTLAAVSLVAGLFGAQVMVNFYTVYVSLVLGAPGAVLVMVKTLWI